MQTQHILGLDIGQNSVGWAVVECRPDAEGRTLPVRLADLNSYIFQEAVNAKNQVPHNAERRQNRLMRRHLGRRASRRRGLVEILRAGGFLPKEWDAPAANKIDLRFAERVLGKPECEWTEEEKHRASPFAMRAWALDNPLEPHEFGRVILHLHRRRGFRSNRGAKYLDLLAALGLSDFAPEEGDSVENEEDAEKKKELGKVLQGIPHLIAQMKERGSRTVGEHVWKLAEESQTAPARITTSTVHFAEVRQEARGKTGMEKIGLYANREMTENEFDTICAAQMKFGLRGLDKAARDKIREAVFEQFPVQSPPPRARRLKHLRYNAVGKCALEPGRRRADKAAPVSQEFRAWAVINNIRMKEDGEITTPEMRRALFDACQDPAKLNKQGRLTWTDAAKIVGVKKGGLNYDRGDDDAKTGLPGNRTFQNLLRAMGAAEWARINAGPDNLANLTEDLLTMTSKLALYNRLVRRWRFTPGPDGVAFKLAILDLEPGHMKYSRRAMARALPHMREGKNEHDALEAAGYGEARAGVGIHPGDPAKEWLPLAAIPETANPRVQRVMFAVRRVVNAVARKWGKPAAIRVEMPREMKASKKHRSEIESLQGANRKRNDEAETALIEHAKAEGNSYHLSPLDRALAGRTVCAVSRAERDKYKMWKFEQDCKCPYCGACIGINDLLSEAFEVDHILPQSAFRQSYMNTVVACQNCNREKSGRTPWQAWGGTDQWDNIARRAALDGKKARMPNLPKEKRRRILNKREDFLANEDFCQRALQDTQHIAKLVHGFLKAAGIPVQVSRGQATAVLRREWGLEDILPRHPDDELKEADIEDGVVRYDPDRAAAAKNRRDHRHHAVDAFVVALTDHAMLMKLTRHAQLRRQAGPKARPDPLDVPDKWEGNMRGQVRDCLNAKVVAHQKRGKVRGALHIDTIHGRGFFSDEEPWQPNRNGRKRVKELLRPAKNLHRPNSRGDIDEDGNVQWIADARIFDGLAEWAEKPPGAPLPPKLAKKLTGKDGKMEIPVARRFYFYRRALTAALNTLKRGKGGKWEAWRPGSGGKTGWIVDRGIHDALCKWMEQHKLRPGNDKGIKRALESDPPQTPAREGRRGNPIRTVRMGMIKDGVKTLAPKARRNRPAPPPRSVELRNNHHLEIFCRGDKRKPRMVSMLEAAERKSRREPIVNREPDPEWGEGWEFQCSLAQGDLVVFDREKVDTRVRGILEKHELVFRSTVYRVQKMSLTLSLRIAFRHHSVTGTSDKDLHGLVYIHGPDGLACRKAEIGVLGADFPALER